MIDSLIGRRLPSRDIEDRYVSYHWMFLLIPISFAGNQRGLD